MPVVRCATGGNEMNIRMKLLLRSGYLYSNVDYYYYYYTYLGDVFNVMS